MVKLILDADASIKLSKISLIVVLSNAFEIILTKEVYEEQVVVGLKKGYSDAKRVETLVKSKKIGVKEVESVYDDSKLGKGEKSVIDFCLSVGVELVVSDDEAFLKVLDGFINSLYSCSRYYTYAGNTYEINKGGRH